ncbi:hypothetical protein AWRI1631_91590 [Saccharomyces cerevisiae AWRI1631]|uniref:Uncharacterized protein n=1 Tax=Saccharomyces cerevisiae (strain AWRI1631) TaxID=545124 RepID=B5VKU4_YEAS6|nr:hypothetical protein AWRI1631_91590 [Saccharomyces cerevisiae AWRI1631]
MTRNCDNCFRKTTTTTTTTMRWTTRKYRGLDVNLVKGEKPYRKNQKNYYLIAKTWKTQRILAF